MLIITKMRIFSSYYDKLVNFITMGYYFCMETVKIKTKSEELKNSFVSSMDKLIQEEDGLDPSFKQRLSDILGVFKKDFVTGGKHDNRDVLNRTYISLLEIVDYYSEMNEFELETTGKSLQAVINLITNYS